MSDDQRKWYVGQSFDVVYECRVEDILTAAQNVTMKVQVGSGSPADLAPVQNPSTGVYYHRYTLIAAGETTFAVKATNPNEYKQTTIKVLPALF